MADYDRHEFKSFYTGVTCDCEVVRDGTLDVCGERAGAPVHSSRLQVAGVDYKDLLTKYMRLVDNKGGQTYLRQQRWNRRNLVPLSDGLTHEDLDALVDIEGLL